MRAIAGHLERPCRAEDGGALRGYLAESLPEATLEAEHPRAVPELEAAGGASRPDALH